MNIIASGFAEWELRGEFLHGETLTDEPQRASDKRVLVSILYTFLRIKTD